MCYTFIKNTKLKQNYRTTLILHFHQAAYGSFLVDDLLDCITKDLTKLQCKK